MKVYYDYQIILMQRFGGISRYFHEIIARLEYKPEVHPKVRCVGSSNYYFDEYFTKQHPHIHRLEKKLKKRVSKVINRELTKLDLKHHYDVVHPTYYDPYILDMCHYPIVLTVYDMISEIFRESFTDSDRENKSRMIHAADHMIAISESTKRDIIRFYPEIPSEKITVIYIGSNLTKVDDAELRNNFPSKYVLFVGDRRAYKNFNTFSEAMEMILENDSELHVVCTGGGPFKEEEIKALGNKAERYHQINCDDNLLSAAYMNAQCFVFPSKYEGFGIPVLEAFACDCPVILSNTSSLPEVGGDAAEYCDPNNIESIRDAIVKVLYSPEHRNELILKGREQRKKFDWNVITEQTLECYRKVIKAHESQKQDSEN